MTRMRWALVPRVPIGRSESARSMARWGGATRPESLRRGMLATVSVPRGRETLLAVVMHVALERRGSLLYFCSAI